MVFSLLYEVSFSQSDYVTSEFEIVEHASTDNRHIFSEASHICDNSILLKMSQRKKIYHTDHFGEICLAP